MRRKILNSSNLCEALRSCTEKNNYKVGILFENQERRDEFIDSLVDYICKNVITGVESAIQTDGFQAVIKFKNGSRIETLHHKDPKIENDGFSQLIVDCVEKDGIIKECGKAKYKNGAWVDVKKNAKAKEKEPDAIDIFLKEFKVF